MDGIIENFMTKNTIKVKDIMTRNVIIDKDTQNIAMIAKKMRDYHIGGIILVNDYNQLCGIITERDIISRVICENMDPHTTIARDIMTRKLLTGNPEMSDIELTVFFTKNHIKKIPILENGQLVGIVTETDLMKSTMNRMEKMVLNMINDAKR